MDPAPGDLALWAGERANPGPLTNGQPAMSAPQDTLVRVDNGIAQAASRPSGPQRLVNASWPSNPRKVPTRPRIPVMAHLVWADSQEWVPGQATRWVGRHVFVAVWHEKVRPVHGVWLDASDVRRR